MFLFFLMIIRLFLYYVGLCFGFVGGLGFLLGVLVDVRVRK